MDIFFQDPTAIPLPPSEVRITELRAELLPDKRRVRVFLEITPFQKRPNGEVRIDNARGEELASVSIIETMIHKMEFTLHLRGAELVPPYTLSAVISYLEEPPADKADTEINPQDRAHIVVHRREMQFGA